MRYASPCSRRCGNYYSIAMQFSKTSLLLEPRGSRVRPACAGYTPQLHDISGHPHVSGGDDRDRTGDLLLAKQVLSQLSYVPTPVRLQLAGEPWWAHLDLNQGPRPYQGRALTN